MRSAPARRRRSACAARPRSITAAGLPAHSPTASSSPPSPSSAGQTSPVLLASQVPRPSSIGGVNAIQSSAERSLRRTVSDPVGTSMFVRCHLPRASSFACNGRASTPLADMRLSAVPGGSKRPATENCRSGKVVVNASLRYSPWRAPSPGPAGAASHEPSTVAPMGSAGRSGAAESPMPGSASAARRVIGSRTDAGSQGAKRGSDKRGTTRAHSAGWRPSVSCQDSSCPVISARRLSRARSCPRRVVSSRGRVASDTVAAPNATARVQSPAATPNPVALRFSFCASARSPRAAATATSSGQTPLKSGLNPRNPSAQSPRRSDASSPSAGTGGRRPTPARPAR